MAEQIRREDEQAQTLTGRWSWISRVALICSAATLAIVLGCAPITGGIANKVYPNLAQPEETEAPPTFSTFPPSNATEAIIGGRGQGLNCSIPQPLKSLAFERKVDGASVGLRFRQSCVMHDFCYRHGYATYGYTQADCDTMLQESAYRLCRQIYRPASDSQIKKKQGEDRENELQKRNVYDQCETEAKKVLLGVVLGGAGSYKPAGHSTYFEYDPMPNRADNYVVGRALPQSDMENTTSDLGVRTFFIKRNTVQMRILKSQSDASAQGGKLLARSVLFPERRIVTPPVITGMPGVAGGTFFPPLVSLARDSFGDTSMMVIGFDTTPLDPAPGQPPTLALTTCSGGIDGPCASKADASIHKFAIVEGKPLLISLTHRGTFNTKGAGTTVKLVQKELMNVSRTRNVNDTPLAVSLTQPESPEESGISTNAPNARQNNQSKLRMDDYPLNGTTAMQNKYRFLQHDVLLEKNHEGQTTHAWVLGRGAKVETGLSETPEFTTDDSGSEYESRLVVARQALGNNKSGEIQRFMLDARETDEPLSLIRLGPVNGSALTGLAWTESDLKRIQNNQPPVDPPQLKIWRVPATGAIPAPKPLVLALPLAVKDGYIDLPPIFARLSEKDAPLLILTNISTPSVQTDTSEHDHPIKSVPTKLDITFRIEGLESGSNDTLKLAPWEQFRCQLDLDAQLRSDEAETLRTRAYRAESRDHKQFNKLQPESLPDDVRNRGVSDLANRWRMSQLIASERRLSDQGSALALTLVFNGFPALSFQTLLRPTSAGLTFDRVVSQPSFLKCMSL
ncbi:hypothetical protein ACIOYV_06355 [Pseudomonas sp. NPDC087342]|uniref:hypothetical protein n=1 Tax=Pseudomonas sp. NPDC087342 TaxID=3364437 RepID=UPI0037F7712C